MRPEGGLVDDWPGMESHAMLSVSHLTKRLADCRDAGALGLRSLLLMLPELLVRLGAVSRQVTDIVGMVLKSASNADPRRRIHNENRGGFKRILLIDGSKATCPRMNLQK